MFTESDLEQIRQKGISLNIIEKQLELFQNGIPFVKLEKPAIPGDGIEILSETDRLDLVSYFENSMSNFTFAKFIPASGAASRMFKDLFQTMSEAKKENFDPDKLSPQIKDFFIRLKDYPFYNDLEKIIIDKGENPEKLYSEKQYGRILDYLLTPLGLNYGNLPKGLLKFHSYQGFNRTALEEHYEEAALFLTGESATVNLHFTVSGEHLDMFKQITNQLNEKYKNQKGIIFNTGFSLQHPSTDTIAVETDNTPFRIENESLLFRPGGHGALLENLNNLEQSVIFVGNIDNVSPDNNKTLRVEYKKLLGGFLLKKQACIHSLLDRIQNGERSQTLKKHIIEVLSEAAPSAAAILESESNDLFNEKAYDLLNRPLRVCGMVKNVGEPGGGPFWIKNRFGVVSRQIVESSQINLQSERQKNIFLKATHFNPVDLVCSIKNHKGEKFDLLDYRDSEMAFIARKSQEGRELKALELPGLWNGAMADWLTWFVDVPLQTFTPVKTVLDLLRPEHFTPEIKN